MTYKDFISENGKKVAPTHTLKLDIKYCTDVYSGRKSFELRFNDRNYKVGDTIRFIPYENGEPVHHPISECTYIISYILSSDNLAEICRNILPSHYVILAIKELP